MSRAGVVRRRPFSSLLLLALVLLLAWCWHERVALQAFAQIISAYTAKEYCSCRYVMQRPVDDCQAYVRQFIDVRRFLDDPGQRRVSAEGLGQHSSARWISPREGCRLEP